MQSTYLTPETVKTVIHTGIMKKKKKINFPRNILKVKKGNTKISPRITGPVAQKGTFFGPILKEHFPHYLVSRYCFCNILVDFSYTLFKINQVLER